MFVTVVAVLCRLSAASSGSCIEEIVTDSNMTPEMSMMQCAIGAQAPLAKWMGEHPIYHANWRLDRYKCVPGRYEIKGHAYGPAKLPTPRRRTRKRPGGRIVLPRGHRQRQPHCGGTLVTTITPSP